MISSNFIFNFTNFCIIVSFLIKLLTLGISFSTAILVILGILFLISFILTLIVVVVVKLVKLVISFLTSFILPSRVVLVDQLVIQVFYPQYFWS